MSIIDRDTQKTLWTIGMALALGGLGIAVGLMVLSGDDDDGGGGRRLPRLPFPPDLDELLGGPPRHDPEVTAALRRRRSPAPVSPVSADTDPADAPADPPPASPAP